MNVNFYPYVLNSWTTITMPLNESFIHIYFELC